MIIYCLVLQSTTWMSSACTDSLGHGCANDGLWHPVCSSSLACCLSLLSDYADKTVLAAAQDQVRGLDLQNAFFSIKKKKKLQVFPEATFLTCFTAFPHKHLSWQSYRGTVLQLGNQKKSRGWNETAIPPDITATGDKAPQSCSLTICS